MAWKQVSPIKIAPCCWLIIIIISKTMFMVLSSWQNHCESSPGSFDECRTAPISGRRPRTKPVYLGCESACTGCQELHPPSPFIIITQPESWYSFYRPTENRRRGRPSWLVPYRHGLPVHKRSPILVLIGSDQGFFKDQFRTAQSSKSMASAEREPITGVWAEPPAGIQGAEPPVGGQGAKPPEAGQGG